MVFVSLSDGRDELETRGVVARHCDCPWAATSTRAMSQPPTSPHTPHGGLQAVYSFTHQVVDALVKQGTPPKAVQIGNEITAGFLWNNSTADELCETGGRLYCKNGTANWKQFSALVQRGIDAVRSACPTAEVAIHTDLGNHIATLGIAHVISWYTSLAHGIAPARFDRIGLSLYPAYTDGRTMESVAELTHLAAAFPACVVYIAETSYPAAGKSQPEALFPPTPAGQLAYLQALRTALASAMTPAQNGGLLWWEGSETSWTSLWDSDFVARPALLKGFTNT
jgi:arabinogalactan endo-1,4-beta-galactosidase